MTETTPLIPANPFDRLWRDTQEDLLAAIERVGQSGWYVLGSEVESFERQFAMFTGFQEAIGCGNGLDAIEIGLRASGLRSGEKVLTTPLSAFATTLAIIRAGIGYDHSNDQPY